jgi:polygalacturonase
MENSAGGWMKSFDAMRRDVLRMGGIGAAVAGIPAFSLAAAAQEASVASASLLGVYDVRRFGATGDGKTLDTQAVNRAIEAAAAAGGGMVIFPAGTYLCFSIHLKSQVHLYLSQGATILAADSPKPGEQSGYNGGAYDAAEPNTAWDAYQDYGHNHWHNSLLWGEDLHDVSITGPGLIYGKGLSFGAGPAPSSSTVLPGFGAPASRPGAPPPPPRHFSPRGDYPMYQAEQPGVGNKAIALKNCRNVLFRDFSILKGGHFGFLLTGVDNVTIDNIKIDTDRDGIDIDCCQNVRVSNCTVNSPWDDGICPKSSYALGYARPTRNVTIANNWVTGCYQLGTVLDGTYKKFPADQRPYGTGRIKCGTESNGGFINITITGNVFEGCFGYALESVDGALVEDITISNTTLRDLASGPLFYRLGSRLRGPKESTKVGTFRRVLVNNLTCYNASARQASVLSGIPNYPLEDLKFSDIYIETGGGGTAEDARAMPTEQEDNYPDPGRFGVTPSTGLFLRHIRNLEMSHIEIANRTADARPPFYLGGVERADLFALTGPRAADGAILLRDVKDLRIGWSRAAADGSWASVDEKAL